MQYGTFRRKGFFIGSGVIEAGCKTVIGARCKQSGMFGYDQAPKTCWIFVAFTVAADCRHSGKTDLMLKLRATIACLWRLNRRNPSCVRRTARHRGLWLRRYIKALAKMPLELPSEKKLEVFLTDLALVREISASTQNQVSTPSSHRLLREKKIRQTELFEAISQSIYPHSRLKLVIAHRTYCRVG